MLFVSLLVVAFLDIIGIDQQITTNYTRSLQAAFIADAGLETAVYELRQDDSYAGTGSTVEFPAGSGNTYDVSVSGGVITSTGTVRGISRTIEGNFTVAGASSPYTVTVNTWDWDMSSKSKNDQNKKNK